MTNKSISQLSSGAAVAATDLFPDVQTAGVGPVKVTAAQIKTFTSASPTLVTPVISGNVRQTVSSTATSAYHLFGDGSTTFAQIGGYYDSATTGHLEFYTLQSGVLTEAGRFTTTGLLTLTNALPVGSGGTGTATAFTAGSVVFAGASGVYSQDNANLFWDDTNNRLGISTTTPAVPLESYVSAGSLQILSGVRNSTGGAGVAAYGFCVANSAGAEGSGYKAGIGLVRSGTFGRGSIAFYNNNVADTANFTTSNEIARFDTAGQFLVGTTAAGEASGVGSKILPIGKVSCVNAGTDATVSGFTLYSSGASAYRFYVLMDGTIHATSTSISGISDATLKTNVRPLETGLSELMQLQPRRFDWLDGSKSNVAGFIAQEIEGVLPDLVDDNKYNDKENKKSIRMGDMIPTIVKAIQELAEEVESLKANP